MKESIGLWIDHRKAVIVGVSGDVLKTRVIESRLDAQNQYGRQEEAPDDMREDARKEHLTAYFNEVVADISDAQAILIFGPGEAKGELSKFIEGKPIRNKVVGVETVDKMTDRQIEARVRRAFPPSLRAQTQT